GSVSPSSADSDVPRATATVCNDPTDANFSPRSRRDRKPLSSWVSSDNPASVNLRWRRIARIRNPTCWASGAVAAASVRRFGGMDEGQSERRRLHDATFVIVWQGRPAGFPLLRNQAIICTLDNKLPKRQPQKLHQAGLRARRHLPE